MVPGGKAVDLIKEFVLPESKRQSSAWWEGVFEIASQNTTEKGIFSGVGKNWEEGIVGVAVKNISLEGCS